MLSIPNKPGLVGKTPESLFATKLMLTEGVLVKLAVASGGMPVRLLPRRERENTLGAARSCKKVEGISPESWL